MKCLVQSKKDIFNSSALWKILDAFKGAMVFANARASGCAEIWSQKELQE
jgi:hypothetical protein